MSVEDLAYYASDYNLTYEDFKDYHNKIVKLIKEDNILYNCAKTNDDQNLSVHIFNELKEEDQERIIELYIVKSNINYINLIEELYKKPIKYNSKYIGAAYNLNLDNKANYQVMISSILKYCTNLETFKDNELKIFSAMVEDVLIKKKPGFEFVCSNWFKYFGYNTSPSSIIIFSELITERFCLTKEKFDQYFKYNDIINVPDMTDFN